MRQLRPLSVLILVLVSGCVELTPTEKCAKRGEIFSGHTGDQIRCEVAAGRQNICVTEATKRYAESGLVILGYRLFDTERQWGERSSTLMVETMKCQIKYPCGATGNGPCTD